EPCITTCSSRRTRLNQSSLQRCWACCSPTGLAHSTCNCEPIRIECDIRHLNPPRAHNVESVGKACYAWPRCLLKLPMCERSASSHRREQRCPSNTYRDSF